MMKCIIVDDERLAREGLEWKVSKIDFLQLVGQFSNGMDAYNFLAKNKVDLLFLDIQMPDITGIELLQSLSHAPMVILTTAYSEYALQGFELDVIDYLLKPIDNPRFIKAVNKAKDIWESSKGSKELASIEDNFVYFRADRQYIKVFFEQIKYLEGMKNYVMVHTLSERFMTPISLKIILEQLPTHTFTRISKSHIINIQFIERVLPNFILLTDDIELPFGKIYQEDFIKNYVNKNLIKRN